MKMIALKYTRLQPAWYDFIPEANFIVNGLINTSILNNQKRYFDKLREMELYNGQKIFKTLL